MDHYNQGGATSTFTAATTPRPGTPESDPIETVRPNPFATPYGSVPTSRIGSSTALQSGPPPRYFHSRRIRKGETERPWLEKKDPKAKWVTIIPLIGIFIGLGLTGFLIYDGLTTITNHKYCPVLDEDFSGGLNSKVWTKETEVGGFG
jgi:hypothetical protein